MIERSIQRLGTICPRMPYLRIGKEYLVSGYHTGEFIGRCESTDRELARFIITDPMRPLPRVKNRCAFPWCVKEDLHEGDHERTRMRRGGSIDIFWRNAQFTPLEAMIPRLEIA